MRELAGTRVLVTGAAGFLGASVVRSLVAAGAEVHALVRASTQLARLSPLLRDIRLQHADVTDAEGVASAFRAARPEVVFHLAMAPGQFTGPGEMMSALRTAIDGTANLLGAASAGPLRRFVHAGSALEYAPADRPLREDDPIRPGSPRGVAKAAASRLCRAFAAARRCPVIVLRVFSVYGPGEPEHRLVPTAVRAALEGGELRLTGPGLSRDLVYIEDVSEALLRAAVCEAEPGACVNVGTGVQFTNEEVAALVSRASGRPLAVRAGTYRESPCDSPSRVADTRRAEALLGWRARHTFADGLAKTIEAREAAFAR